MSPFVGTFEHGLDDKGRVVLPAAFRSGDDEHWYVTQWEQCLGVWTEEGFADVAARLTEKVREGLTTQNAVRAFAANAVEVRPDGQGRIHLPQRLRVFAGLDRDVVIIGAIDRVEIWDAERWGQLTGTAEHSLQDAVTGLGL